MSKFKRDARKLMGMGFRMDLFKLENLKEFNKITDINQSNSTTENSNLQAQTSLTVSLHQIIVSVFYRNFVEHKTSKNRY